MGPTRLPQGSRIRLRLRRSFALLTELRLPMLYSPIGPRIGNVRVQDVRERVQVRRPAFPPSFIFHRLACRKEDRKFSHGGHGDHGGNLSCRSKACVGFQPCLAINHSNNPKQTLITTLIKPSEPPRPPCPPCEPFPFRLSRFWIRSLFASARRGLLKMSTGRTASWEFQGGMARR